MNKITENSGDNKLHILRELLEMQADMNRQIKALQHEITKEVSDD